MLNTGTEILSVVSADGITENMTTSTADVLTGFVPAKTSHSAVSLMAAVVNPFIGKHPKSLMFSVPGNFTQYR
jgi:hypothetical protein